MHRYKSHETSVPHAALDRIPGYSGHMPNVNAENIVGTSWHATTVVAAEKTPRREDRPEAELQTTPRQPLRNVRLGTDVPGYAGHVPGVHEAAACGGTYRSIRDEAAQLAGRATTQQVVKREVGAYHAQDRENVRESENRRRAIEKDRRTVKPLRVKPLPPDPSLYEGLRPIPLAADSTYNMDFAKSATPRESPRNDGGRARSTPSKASAIPGYAGHVPHKTAGNVIGKTWRGAVDKAVTDKFNRPGLHECKPFPGEEYRTTNQDLDASARKPDMSRNASVPQYRPQSRSTTPSQGSHKKTPRHKKQ